MDNPWSSPSPTQEALEGSPQVSLREGSSLPGPFTLLYTPAESAVLPVGQRAGVVTPTSGVQSPVATLPNLQGKVRELENFSHSNNPERAINEYTARKT